jgi:hypothetical protein
MSRWPELAQQPVGMSRRDQAVSLAVVVVAGTVGWIAVFAGLRLWCLGVCAAATLWVLSIAGRNRFAHDREQLLAMGVAFLLLSWPVLWVIVALVRWWITGDTIGS